MEDVKPVICTVCRAPFSQPEELTAHAAQAHGGDVTGTLDHSERAGSQLGAVSDVDAGEEKGVERDKLRPKINCADRRDRENCNPVTGTLNGLNESNTNSRGNHFLRDKIQQGNQSCAKDGTASKTHSKSSTIRKTRISGLRNILLGANEDFEGSQFSSTNLKSAPDAACVEPKSALMQCDKCDMMFKTVAAVNQHVYVMHQSEIKEPQPEVKAETDDVEPRVVAGSLFMNAFAWGDRAAGVVSNSVESADNQHSLGLNELKCKLDSPVETNDDANKGGDVLRKREAKKEPSDPTAESGFECDECLLVFATKKEQSGHKQAAHRKKTNRTEFLCSKCGEKFKKPHELKRHNRKVHQKPTREGKSEKKKQKKADDLGGSQPVLDCESATDSPAENGEGELDVEEAGQVKKLRRQTQESDKAFSCEICTKMFVTRNHLKQHMMIHTGERPHVCAQCGKGFIKRADLFRHETTHSDVKPFLCNLCAKGFGTSCQLKLHIMAAHTGEKPYQCSVCGRGFIAQKYLRTHELIHTGVKKFLCSLCGTGLSSKRRLKAHVMLHNNDKPFKCSECDKCYTTKHHLEKHVEIHQGGPHVCQHCGIEFRTRGYMAKHQRTCSGDGLQKRYTKSRVSTGSRLKARFQTVTCDVCKKLVQKTSLRQHMVIHCAVKPFRCGFCDKTFKRNYLLQEHKRSHTGERPFSCTHCAKTFSRKLGLKVHMRSHGENLQSSKRGPRRDASSCEFTHVSTGQPAENKAAVTPAVSASLVDRFSTASSVAEKPMTATPLPMGSGYPFLSALATDMNFTSQLHS